MSTSAHEFAYLDMYQVCTYQQAYVRSSDSYVGHSRKPTVSTQHHERFLFKPLPLLTSRRHKLASRLGKKLIGTDTSPYRTVDTPQLLVSIPAHSESTK